MTNEDIIKYLMDIKDKQLSACELAAIKAVKMGENYFACPRCGKRVAYRHTHCHWCGQKMTWR